MNFRVSASTYSWKSKTESLNNMVYYGNPIIKILTICFGNLICFALTFTKFGLSLELLLFLFMVVKGKIIGIESIGG